ncbi:SulP family inorganic anion transporter [Tenacibaculum piscium]|uniref:Sodium-independent anion transporter n=5 Tax=Tenacibaculum piscium TaxID=1458515 RepID=A0A2H1YJ60_9FLAO|nr:sulfate permease [Tenacibaculum piscium]MBE7628745.1 sulfate permease [Tenacibaculum piscium]MBE7669886.1 sulfate permease [Tenacibaculum piscium]MBE7684519.1 sulfate permease [Tenacibaculum piscium]MBE7689139.1 sulfate permease [Tenacibaculum piscium]MCG8182974.1 sulfate permease [Tenacibaculum piscium]
MKLKKIIPILDWLPNYKKTQIRGDVIAGITVATVLIPQGIAYALIAGLPPIYGLYAALIPQLIYAVFGSSRQVAIGPVAMDSLIVATGVSTLALIGSESYIAIAILLALMVGTMQLLLGVFRLGFIVNFLSRPVIIGFTSAVALIIGLNQFRNLLGVDFLQSDQVHILLEDIIHRISSFNTNTTIVGFIACLLIIIFRKINKKIPNALIVVILGIVVIRFFGDYLKLTDIAIVKNIPSGLPKFNIPIIDIALIKELFPIASTLVLVGYLEIISIGKTLEAKQDEYRIDPNQELVALGFSNIVGSLFQSYPTTSSFSRSAINEEAGGKTGISAFVSVIIVVLTLLFLTPLFYHLPRTILSAIIIVAVFNLINVSEAKKLWKANQLDFWLLIATFLATIFFGIEYGILIGASLSLIILIYRTSRPYVAELGKVPNSDFYRNKNRFKEVIIDKEILIFRFDAQLFYANANYFRDKLDEMAHEKGTSLKLIVLDAESINRVDSTGIEMLKERIRYYHKRNIAFYFAGVKGPVRDAFFKGGILEVSSLDHFFMRDNGAVNFFKTGDNQNQKKYAQYIHQAYE